jgi:hypothetical protein
MYHSGLNPLKKISRTKGEKVEVIQGIRQRRLHKAFLRYHDPNNWPELRQALKRMGRAELIGYGDQCLVPPADRGGRPRAGRPPVPAHARHRDAGHKARPGNRRGGPRGRR